MEENNKNKDNEDKNPMNDEIIEKITPRVTKSSNEVPKSGAQLLELFAQKEIRDNHETINDVYVIK